MEFTIDLKETGIWLRWNTCEPIAFYSRSKISGCFDGTTEGSDEELIVCLNLSPLEDFNFSLEESR